jgi:DNA-binding beta-propeller fold protein YncE
VPALILACLLLAHTAGATTFLSEIQSPPFGTGPRVVSPDGRFLYTPGTILTRDVGTGLITGITSFDPGVFSPDDIVLGSADAAFLYVSGSGGIAVHARDALTGSVTLVEVELPPQVPGTSDARFLVVSRDGANLYATGLSAIQTYARNPTTGELTFLEEIQDGDDPGEIDGLWGTNDVVVSPDGLHVYVTGGTDGAVLVFARSGPGGTLVHLDTYDLSRPDVMVMSPDGLDLYVACGSGIARYVRNPLDGTLGLVGMEPAVVPEGLVTLVDDTEQLVMTTDGSRLVARVSTIVIVYDRDVGTGELTFLTLERVSGRRDTEVSPDGMNVYAGSKQMSVFVFATAACTPAPALGCKPPFEPRKSSLAIKDSDPFSDKITWKTNPAGTTTVADFGDPIGGADHLLLCIYDASANPQPVAEILAPARGTCSDEPCWFQSSPTTLKYVDSSGFPAGFQKFTVRTRDPARAAMRTKSKGRALAVPALPLTPPVKAQLQSVTGSCWEATYSVPKRNTVTTFNAKSD